MVGTKTVMVGTFFNTRSKWFHMNSETKTSKYLTLTLSMEVKG